GVPPSTGSGRMGNTPSRAVIARSRGGFSRPTHRGLKEPSLLTWNFRRRRVLCFEVRSLIVRRRLTVQQRGQIFPTAFPREGTSQGPVANVYEGDVDNPGQERSRRTVLDLV